LQAIRDFPRGVKLTVVGTSFLLNNALTSCSSSPDTVSPLAPKIVYIFEKHSIPHRDNVPEYFQKDLKVKHETLAPGVHVVRDAGMTFYVVQVEDFTTKTTYEKKVISENKKVAVKK
jgi:adenosylmethionine-8-amino-7-oxononanoate aminotransferase